MPRRRLDGKEKAHSMSIFFDEAATGRCGGGWPGSGWRGVVDDAMARRGGGEGEAAGLGGGDEAKLWR